jgi:hypothetical protein
MLLVVMVNNAETMISKAWVRVGPGVLPISRPTHWITLLWGMSKYIIITDEMVTHLIIIVLD